MAYLMDYKNGVIVSKKKKKQMRTWDEKKNV